MQDLDLDELDQAVNNIMTKPKGRRAAKKSTEGSAGPVAARQEPAAVRAPDLTQKPNSEPVALQTESKENSEGSPVTPPRAPESMRVTVNRPMPKVPERRRMHPGAMDIIQPNAPPKAAAPSTRPSRTAAALQPAQDGTPEPARSVAPAAPQLKPEPMGVPEPQSGRRLDTPQDVSDEVLASLSLLDEKKPDAGIVAPVTTREAPTPSTPKPQSTVSAEPAQKSSDGWPDPLDFHDFSGNPAVATASVPAPTTTLTEAPVETPKEIPPSLSTEPVSVTDSHDDAATVSSSPFVTTKVEKRPLGAFANAAPEPVKAPLPEPANAPVPHESTNKSELAEASLESKQHLSTPQNHDDFDKSDLRPMTVPPQRHAEQASKEDVRHVFDTKEYHAAPPHMYAPRKGGPGLVIGVVVLIVLIVAAVLVGYFMMTGTFDVTKLW